jgi:hypothetical protein
MWGARSLYRTGAQTSAHRRSVLRPETTRAPPIIPDRAGKRENLDHEVPGYKPAASPGIYLFNTLLSGISTQRSLVPVGRGAGFSRFPPLVVGGGESRTADGPCLAA